MTEPGITQYTSKEVQSIVGCTARQIQWWDEEEIVVPMSNNGSRRLYSPYQVVECAIVMDIRRRSGSSKMVRMCLECLRDAPKGVQYIGVRPGFVAVAFTGPHILQWVTKHPMGAVFIVDVALIAFTVRSKLAHMEDRAHNEERTA